MDFANATLTSLSAALASRSVSSVELARAALDRINTLQPALNAFIEVFADEARARAADLDAQRATGAPLGPLAGIPVALKDNLCLAWGHTTCASRILKPYRSPYTATAVQRLIDAGMVILGKTNLDEFAMGSSTEHSCFGPTRNPWDPTRVPGGSSGGSAVAVAAGAVPLALGSDTGGSIRQPAGHCGVVGVKPTYGRISRYGLIAYASSLDQIGPFTRSVSDAALALQHLCGHDPLDSTSSPNPVPAWSSTIDHPIAGLRVGVPRQVFSPANHPEVARLLGHTIDTFTRLGAVVEEVDLALSDFGIAAYYIVAPAEASSNLARFDGIRYGYRAELPPGADLTDLYCRTRTEGFGPEVQRRIMLGTHVLSSGYYDAYYNTALKARRRIKQDFDRIYDAGVHVILMPASPGPAFPLGSKTSDPLAMYLEDVYTVMVNLAGLPALTIPVGLAQEERAALPVGMQLIAAPFAEDVLLRAARMFETAAPFTARPPV